MPSRRGLARQEIRRARASVAKLRLHLRHARFQLAGPDRAAGEGQPPVADRAAAALAAWGACCDVLEWVLDDLYGRV